MTVAGVGSNPFALGHAIGERANQQGELYQLLAQRVLEQEAAKAAAADKFQQDFVLGVLKDSKALGELFGAGGVARLMNKSGQALGPVVQDPHGFANIRDALTLDALRSGAIKDLMNGVASGVGVGIQPSIDPNVAARLGIPGFRDVLPPAMRIEGMKEGAANSRQSRDQAWRSGENALDRQNRMDVERLKDETRRLLDAPKPPQYTVEVAPPDLLSGNSGPKVTTRGQGGDVNEVRRGLGLDAAPVTGVTPAAPQANGAPPRTTSIQQDAINRMTSAGAKLGTQVEIVGGDAGGNVIVRLKNGDREQMVIVDPMGKAAQ